MHQPFAMSHSTQLMKTEGGDGSSGESSAAAAGVALPGVEKMAPWGAEDLLPEDYPVIDPFYQRSDLVSPVALSPSQSGLPPEAWVPGEWHRESSGASVVEPNSVTEENGRTYHGYKQGKYFGPNDGVSKPDLIWNRTRGSVAYREDCRLNRIVWTSGTIPSRLC